MDDTLFFKRGETSACYPYWDMEAKVCRCTSDKSESNVVCDDKSCYLKKSDQDKAKDFFKAFLDVFSQPPLSIFPYYKSFSCLQKK